MNQHTVLSASFATETCIEPEGQGDGLKASQPAFNENMIDDAYIEGYKPLDGDTM